MSQEAGPAQDARFGKRYVVESANQIDPGPRSRRWTAPRSTQSKGNQQCRKRNRDCRDATGGRADPVELFPPNAVACRFFKACHGKLPLIASAGPTLAANR